MAVPLLSLDAAPSAALPAGPVDPATSLPRGVTDIGPAPVRTWLLRSFVLGPVVGLALAIVLAAVAGLAPSALDLGLAVGLFVLTAHGITIGYHRFFTHGSFRASRPLKVALAVVGSLALEGDVTGWVAIHRLHHARADRDGDPHSPWRYGTGARAVAKGLVWAQVGWLFAHRRVSKQTYAPDLLADRDLQRVDRLYPLWIVLTLLGPAAVGGLVTLSWTGALTAFLWAGLARILLLHHVTWMVNSLCHVVGDRPFRTRRADRASNVRALALISMGDSWHNLHHADPTCARHGVDRGQLDSSARVIRAFERLGWATDVRWPDDQRLARRRRPTHRPAASSSSGQVGPGRARSGQVGLGRVRSG